MRYWVSSTVYTLKVFLGDLIIVLPLLKKALSVCIVAVRAKSWFIRPVFMLTLSILLTIFEISAGMSKEGADATVISSKCKFTD
jgi:hypothetical protein